MRKEKTTWKFREGRSYPVAPEVIGKEHERIKSVYGNTNPETIVEEARKESSPLHSCFRSWDVAVAAHQHWLAEARELTTSVIKVIITKEDQPERSFNVSIVREDGNRGYVQSVDMMSDEQARQQLLGEGSAIIKGWFDRFELLGMLGPFVSAVEALLETYKAKLEEKTKCPPKRKQKSA